MPLYSYKCQTCSEVTDASRSIADRADAPSCAECGSNTKKIIAKYTVHPDFAEYYDDNLETHITSKQHRKKVMKERDVVELVGKGWSSW